MARSAIASALTRPLALRRRLDLQAVPQWLRGERVWAIKDPLGLQHFHLRETEYWVLQQLNGQTTLGDIVRRFSEQFAPQRLRVAELQNFLATLHQSGLVIANAPGQGGELLRRRSESRTRKLQQLLTNPLAIRFRGIDPDRWLTWCEPRIRWMFTSWVAALGMALVSAALLLVATRIETVIARLPEREAFFSPENLFWLAVALGGVKVLHELGHALTCKHLGGECHEMGLMLLVFTPCLYCNVSDAWMFPGKWQRAAVGFAGVAVELTLASIATFLWWFSAPGMFNSLCLNVMFVCSIGTLLVNGNPLFRYDGYFVLSDLLEMPNLASQAAQRLKAAFARIVFGVELPEEELLAGERPILLILYALLATAYRWVVLAGVLWMIHRALQPYRLEGIAEFLAIAVVVSLVAGPAWRAGKFVTHPHWRREMQKPRAAVGLIALLFVCAGLLAIPIPQGIAAVALVHPLDARRVFAVVPGRLIEARSEGDSVAVGETLARLDNSELEVEILRLRGERDQQKLRVENLKRRQILDGTAAAQVPAAEELLADLANRLTQRERDSQRLTIVAPVAGTILPPRNVAPQSEDGRLPVWSGTPLAPRNLGCQVETGTLLCQVGDPTRLEALLILDQDDIEFVRAGQSVRLRLDQSPGTPLSGSIAEIAEVDLAATPPELHSHGMLATRIDASGRSRPANTSYMARVTLQPVEGTILPGEAGRARIEVPSRSLGARLLRALRRTFNLDLTRT